MITDQGSLQQSAKAVQWFREIPQAKGSRSGERDEDWHERLSQNAGIRRFHYIKHMFARDRTSVGDSLDPSCIFEDSSRNACRTLVLAMDRDCIRDPVLFRSFHLERTPQWLPNLARRPGCYLHTNPVFASEMQ
jgi:hypothetical protein